MVLVTPAEAAVGQLIAQGVGVKRAAIALGVAPAQRLACRMRRIGFNSYEPPVLDHGLTAAARDTQRARITGAHWSGPRFFGLIKRASRSLSTTSGARR